jgi:predicted HTH transcriptional regulator
LRLDDKRDLDTDCLQRIVETVCGIANAGPAADGFIYIGIVDKQADSERVVALDGIKPVTLEHVQVVGIEREAAKLGIALDKYVKLFEDAFSKSAMTEPLKTQVRAGLDVVQYKGLSVLRIRVPRQTAPSFLGDACFFRAGSSTVAATGPQIAAIAKAFT